MSSAKPSVEIIKSQILEHDVLIHAQSAGRFSGSSFKMEARHRLYTEGMRSDEFIDSYIRRFNQTSKALSMQEEDKVSISITNLTGNLQEHLMTRDPTTLHEAFELARVKAQALNCNKQRIDQESINNRLGE